MPKLNIQQSASTSQNHQSNGQADWARTFSPATIFFNQPVRVVLPKLNSSPLFSDYDEDHYDVKRQDKIIKNSDTNKKNILVPIGSILVVQGEDGSL